MSTIILTFNRLKIIFRRVPCIQINCEHKFNVIFYSFKVKRYKTKSKPTGIHATEPKNWSDLKITSPEKL